MVKARLVFACLCLFFSLPLQAFEWGTATYNGREYVTLQSFCTFYGFYYQAPSANSYFTSRSAGHSIRLKLGASDLYLDGTHYVMSFPVEGADRDWLVSRMDVIKLFDPVLRPTEISGRHSIRGVVIDPGHGGSDNGAVSARGGMEKNYTIDTAYRLEAILRAAGLKTVLTRRTDVFVDLYERAHIASLYPDYAFVSIHYNSATPEARGLETYCLSPRGAASTSSNYLTRSDIQKLPGNDYDAANIVLASMVHSEIIRLNPGDPTADRGVKRARFVVIKQNVLPAILVEGGFVSNRMEAARVNQPDYRQKLAEDIARGVIRFANVMGNRRLELPETISEDNPPPAAPPRALPVTPPAPSGLASELPKTHVKTQNKSATVASQTPTTTTPSTHKKKSKKTAKAKTTVPGPAFVADPPTTTTTPPASHAPSNETPSGPLNLTEPKAPAPSPNSEKAPPEPDEPPTVNIYPTTPTQPSNPPASSGPATPTTSSDNSAAKKTKPTTSPAPSGDSP
jgi:N-acetylmuramoyl-L-alanine amidase